MRDVAEVISALAAFSWPILVAILAFKFFRPVRGLIESARGRKFAVKVGGYELTVEEHSKQQRRIISDIQAKFAELESWLDTRQPIGSTLSEETPVQVMRVLWVDDWPKNNSFLVATLQEQGYKVETALCTTEGIEKFQVGTFDIVISDMGRPEGEKAGIDLETKIRRLDSEIPFFIFCGSWAARNLRQEALEAGVTGITSSETTLLRLLPLRNSI